MAIFVKDFLNTPLPYCCPYTNTNQLFFNFTTWQGFKFDHPATISDDITANSSDTLPGSHGLIPCVPLTLN